MASSSRLKPGEKGKIKMSVDIRGKFGSIYKTVQIQTNDPQRPQATLALKMNVKDLIHMKDYAAAEIFGDACKSCHVERGKGRHGQDLYVADCMMCHSEGKSASPLSEMRTKPREELEKAIRHGVEKTAMPGWDSKFGGPLREEEIRGLIDYVRPTSKNRRSN